MKKTILFLDMDQVIADFCRSPLFDGRTPEYNPPEMYEEGFFRSLPPIEGSLSAVRELINIDSLDIYILTKPVDETHYSRSEKASWISEWFPELRKKVIMSPNKDLNSAPGRILIDDSEKWQEGWEKHGGKFFLFPHVKGQSCHRDEWRETVDKVKNYLGV